MCRIEMNTICRKRQIAKSMVSERGRTRFPSNHIIKTWISLKLGLSLETLFVDKEEFRRDLTLRSLSPVALLKSSRDVFKWTTHKKIIWVIYNVHCQIWYEIFYKMSYNAARLSVVYTLPLYLVKVMLMVYTYGQHGRNRGKVWRQYHTGLVNYGRRPIWR